MAVASLGTELLLLLRCAGFLFRQAQDAAAEMRDEVEGAMFDEYLSILGDFLKETALATVTGDVESSNADQVSRG